MYDFFFHFEIKSVPYSVFFSAEPDPGGKFPDPHHCSHHYAPVISVLLYLPCTIQAVVNKPDNNKQNQFSTVSFKMR